MELRMGSDDYQGVVPNGGQFAERMALCLEKCDDVVGISRLHQHDLKVAHQLNLPGSGLFVSFWS